jgi:hypothetical protein
MSASPIDRRERVRHRRERGLRMINRATRGMAAGSIALTGMVAIAAADAHSPHHKTSSTTTAAHHATVDDTETTSSTPLQTPRSTPLTSSSSSSSSAVSGGS